MAELGKEEALRDEFADSLQNMESHRMREGPSKFAQDYARHLLGGGVESDPMVESIIEEVGAYNHVVTHMALMNMFWHPQPGGQGEAWISLSAVAMKVLEHARAKTRRESE
jgi:hypothetical protein